MASGDESSIQEYCLTIEPSEYFRPVAWHMLTHPHPTTTTLQLIQQHMFQKTGYSNLATKTDIMYNHKVLVRKNLQRINCSICNLMDYRTSNYVNDKCMGWFQEKKAVGY
jgi:hypothetical protein